MSKSLLGSGSGLARGNSSLSIGTKTQIVYLKDPEYDLSANTLDTLKRIQTNYTLKLASRKYDLISTDINEALLLYDQVYRLQLTRKTAVVVTLLQLAMDGLQGAMNAYTIYTRNIEYQIANTLLENKVETILSGKNDVQAMTTNVTGQIGITKTFTLAPLYSYYIMLYGMPEFGVGFDLTKLETVRKVLVKNGIDPQGG
jgi:hypothetical protein